MPRVLILKFGAIGDVVMAIPAVHQLHLAGHQVDWVCGPTVLPLLQLYPWIRPIPIDERALLRGSLPARLAVVARLWRILAGRSYALVATLYYDPRYRLLALPIRAQRKLRLSRTDRSARLIPGRHHTNEYGRLLLGWPDQVRPLPLAPVAPAVLPPSPIASTPQDHAPRPRIVLAPAGAKNVMADDALRRWPAEHYVALARLLLDRGFEVVLIGGPGDAWVQPLFHGLPVIDLIAQLALPLTLALLSEADILVTHDTGPLHLAGVTSVGIVALFGPTAPGYFLPQRPGIVAFWGGEGFACRPCYDGHSFAPCPRNECLSQITPDLVFEQVLDLLASRATGVLSPPRVLTPPSTIPVGRLIPISGVRP